MAEVRVDAGYLLSRLFPGVGGELVRITGIRFDGDHSIFLSIEGRDIPAGDVEVRVVISQKWEATRFELVK